MLIAFLELMIPERIPGYMFYQEDLPTIILVFLSSVNSLLTTGDTYWRKLATPFKKLKQQFMSLHGDRGLFVWGAYFFYGCL